mmetsp:Transcript_55763/g.125950  ORF Transcript_55763/g.125950 Transcript_55763/m.125950 type:complete len:821 (-) Transcript_55763:52-2514(-)
MACRMAALYLPLALLVTLATGMRVASDEELQDPPDPHSPRTEVLHWLGDDYIKIDASTAEAKLRKQSPGILMPTEHAQMAFKVGRNKIYFTDTRVLLRPKAAMFGAKVAFKSIPYKSMKAYAFETSGIAPDFDTKLVLYTNLPDLPSISIGFRKGESEKKANIYVVASFIAKKLLNENVFASKEASLIEMSSNVSLHNGEQWLGDAVAWVLNHASQVDEAQVEKDLRRLALLGDTERVLMAFRVGRDTTLLTSRRLIRIDVMGITGRSINFLTIPYEAMQAYMVRTAGYFDLDAEMRIWTDIPGLPDFKYELRAGKADVKKLQGLLTDKVLGVNGPNSTSVVQTESDDIFDIFHWLSNNFIQVDPQDAENAMRQQSVLQAPGEEWVELGFRIGRDVNVLTNKRLLMVDVQGITGKKVEYVSVPYHAIQAFAVETAGYIDGSGELQIWTGIAPPPARPPTTRDCDAVGNCKPRPPPKRTCRRVPQCLSYFKFDLARNRTDLWRIQEVLSAHVLGLQGHPSSLLQGESGESVVQSNPVVDLYHYMSDNAAKADPETVELKFKKARILQQDEFVQLAFQIGRDFHIWTSERFLLVERKGLFEMGRKVNYFSIPYHSIKGFAVSNAGVLDSDAELEFWTSMPWLKDYKQDLRNDVNLTEIMHILTHELNAYPPHPTLPGSLLQQEWNPFGDAVAWFGNAGYEVDAKSLNTKYHTSKPFLDVDETVTFACKAFRDTTMLTTQRAFLVDKRGLTGTKVVYKSVPYASVGAFLVRSAGIGDVDTEMELFTAAPGLSHIQQNLRSGHADIFKISDLLAKGVLMSAFPQ